MKLMKTRLVSIVIMLSALMCGTVKADNVDLQTAKQIGAYYFNVATGTKTPVSAEKLELVQQFDNPTLCIPALYAFNVANDGFVVVSASNTTEPVLAYSPEGSLDNPNPACQYMLESYAKLISQDQNYNATQTAEVKGKWDELINQTFTCDPASKGVLVKAKWGQGDPHRVSYNIFCPQDQGYPCLVGCVATAMSMIIHYWKYPTKGGSSTDGNTAITSWNNQTIKYKFTLDSNKFVFDSMPNNINERSEWNHKRACGKLSFACGVTVKMNWGLDGSGAHSQDVPKAFWNWFKYSDQAAFIQRAGRSDSQWLKLLHEEIDSNARPVYYSASDPNPDHGNDAAGHAFVIAGSSASNESMFYIRWGWDGGSDGFFTLAPASSIGHAGAYTFTHNHGMVYKIFPKNSVGIEELTEFSPTPAYPNPATDHIMIPADLSFNATLSIFGIDGKLIENVVVPAGTKEYRLNLQGYTPGNYIYRLNGSAVKFTVL